MVGLAPAEELVVDRVGTGYWWFVLDVDETGMVFAG
jgi:hypothetical protein